MLMKTKNRPTHLHIEQVVITPDMAAAFLEKNVHNRKHSSSIVGRLAKDMADGNWRLTGDAIRFDVHGNLIDGQHRLMACKRSGFPFPTMVIYGLDPITQDVIDTGKSRSAADALELRGVTSSKNTAAALRVLIGYRDHDADARSNMISTAQVMDALDRHPNITKSVAQCSTLPRGIPRAAISFVHYVAKNLMHMEDKADAWIAVWRDGLPSYADDPVHTYRERLLRLGSNDERIRSIVQHWTTFYVWNQFAKSRPILTLRYQRAPVLIDGLDEGMLE